ncbi:unnamed protein product [Rotaria magnacalcarata]|uniref:Helitron helicase-like domain-containing protein n=1 Tax=Rotaria magnacalcarata TaxID=392030 RepID=A0A8S2ZH43_9BILA|nr:unnamed protein product [Rotaria magnacalcarata]
MKKKELLAMFRQLGCPTIFLTLSAAETKWSELIVILTQVLECLWEILFAPCGSFEGNELEDKYIRVEFQVRGSPHIHVLIWLKNAPKYDKNKPKSIEQCIAFLDKLISVNAKPTEFSEELINLQRHKHSHTCKKHVKNGIKCRFGIPYFPMKKAMILEPFTDDEKFTKKRK